ncbi:MAG: cupin domain-containing protein, partial [Clostridia bacterium]|nr:cupin domain-containing protein [Clostridia bacterium]
IIMFRKAEDRKQEIRHEMRGGNGDVKLIHSFTEDELSSPTRVCATLVLEPGCSIGAHVHDQEEEIFYIIEGTAKASDNGKEVILNAGDSLLTGGGESHCIENIGDKTLKVFAVVIKFA